jgi:hypothetical protein
MAKKAERAESTEETSANREQERRWEESREHKPEGVIRRRRFTPQSFSPQHAGFEVLHKFHCGPFLYILRAISPREIKVALCVLKCLCLNVCAAAGCWLLAAGCWLLAAGCWLLAAALTDHSICADCSSNIA